MSSVPSVTLRDGIRVPMIGLGTWRTPPEQACQAVRDAIDLGYRHFDCAYIYQNEEAVGAALKQVLDEGIVKREDLFITSKLWNTFHHPSLVEQACRASLKSLQLDYLDNYLMHWPMGYKEGGDLYPKDGSGQLLFSDVDYLDTWRALEGLVASDLVRTIGVSNFNREQINRLITEPKCTVPSMLQVECHPYFNQADMVAFCKENNIVLVAYSPLGSGHSPYEKPGECKVLDHPTILKLAKNHGCSPAQVLLRWQVQRGNIVIPRSTNKSHMAANLNVNAVELSASDMARIDSLDCNGRFMTMEAAIKHKDHPFPGKV